MKTFIYNEELYIRVIPCKRLFHSTTIHEVVNRGDIFAMRVRDQVLTIVPGKSVVEHLESKLMTAIPGKTPIQNVLRFLDS